MDPSLKLWRAEGQTFFQRFCHWTDILNPFLLLAEKENIDNARKLLLDAEADSILYKKMETAWQLNVASVNPSNGEIIPALYRPPALLPFAFPLVLAATLPTRKTYQMFVAQSLFHSYVTAFGWYNGNHGGKSKDKRTKEMKKTVLMDKLSTVLGIVYSAIMGTAPHFYMNLNKPRSPLVQFIIRTLLPGPFIASFCAYNVMMVRSYEYEHGIEVMDSKGKVVGLSRKAGEEAVKETALSRAVLFGTAVFVPDLIMHILKRRILFRSFILVKWGVTAVVFGTMIPVTFSWMPQLSKINRNELEPKIVSSTEESELFYYRGI